MEDDLLVPLVQWQAVSPFTWVIPVQVPGPACSQFEFMPKMEVHTSNSPK